MSVLVTRPIFQVLPDHTCADCYRGVDDDDESAWHQIEGTTFEIRDDNDEFADQWLESALNSVHRQAERERRLAEMRGEAVSA